MPFASVIARIVSVVKRLARTKNIKLVLSRSPHKRVLVERLKAALILCKVRTERQAIACWGSMKFALMLHLVHPQQKCLQTNCFGVEYFWMALN